MLLAKSKTRSMGAWIEVWSWMMGIAAVKDRSGFEYKRRKGGL